jgi:hypothetical protein
MMTSTRTALVSLLGLAVLGGCASTAPGLAVARYPAQCSALKLAASSHDVLAGAVWVRSLQTEDRIAKITRSRITGAELFVPAEPGMSAQWLQRVIDCRAQAQAPDTKSPLAIDGAIVEVEALQTGYAVRITSRNAQDAQEIDARARVAHPVVPRASDQT